VGLLLVGCDRETDALPAVPTPAEIPQTTAAGTTYGGGRDRTPSSPRLQVGRTAESDAALSGARESVDTRMDEVEAGVLTFASPEVAHSWAETSESFGGIAVVGDTWAVSLYSDGSGGRRKRAEP
jgi:hypothetical protein